MYVCMYVRTHVRMYVYNTFQAPVDQRDSKGQTALFLACLGGHVNLVRLLVRHGADINHVTNEGFSPFYAACWRNRLEVVRVRCVECVMQYTVIHSSQRAL